MREARAGEDDLVREDGGSDAGLARAVGHEQDGVLGHGEAGLAFEGRFDAFGEAGCGGEVELPCRRSGVVCSVHGVSSLVPAVCEASPASRVLMSITFNYLAPAIGAA